MIFDAFLLWKIVGIITITSLLFILYITMFHGLVKERPLERWLVLSAVVSAILSFLGLGLLSALAIAEQIRRLFI